MTNRSDGSTASYYELPQGCTEIQDIISHRNMNAQDGEIFRAIYRKGRASHSDELRDARKVLFYAQAEVKRLEKSHTLQCSMDQLKLHVSHVVLTNSPPDPQCKVVEPASAIDDDNPRNLPIHQGGELAELVYAAIDASRHPERPRHQCQACGLRHSTHHCTGGEP